MVYLNTDILSTELSSNAVWDPEIQLALVRKATAGIWLRFRYAGT